MTPEKRIEGIKDYLRDTVKADGFLDVEEIRNILKDLDALEAEIKEEGE